VAGDGWVLLEGLIAADDIDAAADDLGENVPDTRAVPRRPGGETSVGWAGRRQPTRRTCGRPTGPGFRRSSTGGGGSSRRGSGRVNRLCVHDAIVDFAERAMQTADIRLYQAGVPPSTPASPNYEQPMHTDRNHSWLPARSEAPWWHVETFLYLSDVDIDHAPDAPRFGARRDRSADEPRPLFMPKWDRSCMPQSAPPVAGADRCSRTGPTSSIAPSTSPRPTRPASFSTSATRSRARIGSATTPGSHAPTGPGWDAFVEGSTPRQLELFGFPHRATRSGRGVRRHAPAYVPRSHRSVRLMCHASGPRSTVGVCGACGRTRIA